jgi:divalent metal cation (Fe/Co/Zn/Cd) transporter
VSQSLDLRERLIRRGLYLEYATLGWNVVGSAVVLASAFFAGSVALAGFGIDSLIEIFASIVVVWQLRGIDDGREAKALRLIGLAFFGLALYILAQSAYVLASGAHPDTSTPGIAWLAATLAAMLLLAAGKRATGEALENPVLIKEGHVTLIDALLAAAVLTGLLLNAVAGWWWADPLAGLVIVYYGLKEGREALAEPRAPEGSCS